MEQLPIQSALQRMWARPTLDCNGIIGGYTGEGAKTIIPAEVSAKITMRLVPNQKPEKIVAGFRQFVAEHTPDGMVASVVVSAEARPVLLATDSPAMSCVQESRTASSRTSPSPSRH